jgi:hypothetical protein
VGAQSGFFETSTPINYPSGALGWWHLIDTRHSNNANNYAMQIAGSFFDQKLYFRKTNGIATQAWSELVTSSCGTINYVPKMTTTGNIGCSQIFDNGTSVGIGTVTPNSKFHVIADGDNIPVIYGVNTNSTAGTTAFGVRGECSAIGLGSAGISGVSTNSGQNEIGVLGDYSLWGASVFGLAWAASYLDMPSSKDFGVFGTVNFSTGTAVYGYGPTSAYALYGNGNFAVTGSKSASVPTTKGNQLVYCNESPELWFEDIGRGKLINGKAHIDLDEMFLETVTIDSLHPMNVFIQEMGQSNGVYVITENTGFEIIEKNSGNSNIGFSYRILAKRRFYEDQRFGCDTNQPFGDNLKNSKKVKPIEVDPIKAKQWVDDETRRKVELNKKLKK